MSRQNTTVKRFSAFFLATCLLALAVSGCQIGSRQPRARYGAAMVWDAEGDQMVLFGGRAKGLFGERVLNDTWLFDLNDQAWRKVNTTSWRVLVILSKINTSSCTMKWARGLSAS